MAGGAGGEEVGRISIRVVPNLDQFRERLKAELEYWDKKKISIKVVADVAEARAKIENAAKDVKATVKTKADTKGVRQKIKSEVDGISSKVKVILDDKVLNRFERRLAASAENAVASYEPNFEITVADEKIRRQVEAKLAELKGLASLPVALDPEVATKDKLFLQGELDRLRAMLQAHAAAKPIKFDLKLNEKATRDMLKAVGKLRDDSFNKVLSDIDKRTAQGIADRGGLGRPLFDDLEKVKVDLDFDAAEAKRLAWNARIAADKITQKIEVDPDLRGLAMWKARVEAAIGNINFNKRTKKLSAADLLPDIGDMAKTLGNELSQGFAKVGSSAAFSLPSLLSFGGILLVIAAAIAVILPPLLALGVGFATLIPGMLALAGPMAAVALGLDGIKKAAERAGLFTDENGDKKGGGTVGAALDSIKQKVSDTFENGLFPAFEKLGTLFPQIEAPMVRVAQGLSDMASGFIDALTDSAGVNNIRSILDNIGVGLSNASPGVRDFTAAILELVEGISQKFPGFGTWFSELMAGFREDMVDFTKPGEDGMSRLDHLIQNVRAGVEGLTGIFQAFWNQGLKDIQDPSFGQHMLDFFNHVRDFVTVTLPQLTQGFENIAAALNVVTGPFEKMSNLMEKLDKMPVVGKLIDFAKQAAGMMSGLKVPMELADFINNSVSGDKGAGDKPIAALQPDRVSQQAVQAATAARQQFLKTFNEMPKDQQTNLLKGFLKGDTSATQEIQQQLNTATSAAKDTMQGEFQAAINGVKAQYQDLAETARTSVTASLTPLLQMPTQVMTAFQAIGGALMGSFGGLIASVATMAQQVATAISSVFVQIPGLILQAMSGAASAAATGGNQIVVGITTPLTQLAGIFTSVFANLVGVVTTSMGQLVQAITQGSQQAVQIVSAIPGQMAGAISAGAGALVGPGQALMAGLKQGIVAGLQDVLAYASTIAGQIAAVKGPLPKDRQELVPAGEALMEGLGTGMDNGFQDVLTRTKAMAKAIFEAMKEVFGSASGANFNFNLGGAVGQTAQIASNAKVFSDNMGSAIQPVKAGKIDAETQSMIDQLKVQKEGLDVERARLQADKNLTSDKGQRALLQQQIDSLNVQKQTLEAQIAQLNFQGKYENSVGETKDLWEGMNQKIVEGISNVGQGVVQSYASDLGIGGNGILSTLAQTGLQWGSQFVFNVSNIDEAMAVQRNQQNKQATGVVGRT